MEDTPQLAIIYAADASTWDSYLGRCFRELSPPGHVGTTLVIHHQPVEQLSSPLEVSRNRLAKQAKAQIVILSPDFLDFVLHNPTLEVGRLFVPSRLLGLLCGIVAEEVTTLHRAGLLSFDLWQTMTVVENDKEFVLSLVQKTLEIMATSQELSKRIPSAPPAQFKLNPRKAREGSAKVSLEFATPNVHNESINIVLESDGIQLCVPAKEVNPYLAKFVVPDRYFGISQMINVHVTRGDTFMGFRQLKCESQIAEMNHLLQSVLHPVSFMCQTLGIPRNRLEDLDRAMADSFKKNLPRLIAYSPPPKSKHTENRKAEEELPTMLHFAAKFGLREVCATLLDCTGAEVACRLRNNRGLTPSEIAESESHHAIAAMLDNFLNVSETAEIYIYMSSMAEDVTRVPTYENVDGIEVRCSRSSKTWSILTSNFDVTDSLDIPTHLRYLGCKEKRSSGEPCLQAALLEEDTVVQRRESDTDNPMERIKLYTQSQQELIHLLEDFKLEKYTIAEVELLFRSWQMSQKVSQTFKQKDEQLKQMRQQYEHYQKQVNPDTKKTSALERFRNFWVRNMKKDNRVDNNMYIRESYQENKDEQQSKSKEHLSPLSPRSNGGSNSDLSSVASCSSGLDNCQPSDCVAEDKMLPEILIPRKVDGMPKTLAKIPAMVMMDNKQYFECSPQSPDPPLPPRKNVTKSSRSKHLMPADSHKIMEPIPPVLPPRPPSSWKPNSRCQVSAMDASSRCKTRTFRQSRPLPSVPCTVQKPESGNSYLAMSNCDVPAVIDDPSYCNVQVNNKSVDYIDMTAVTELTSAIAPSVSTRTRKLSASPLTCHRMARRMSGSHVYVNVPQTFPKSTYLDSNLQNVVPDCPPPAIPTQMSN